MRNAFLIQQQLMLAIRIFENNTKQPIMMVQLESFCTVGRSGKTANLNATIIYNLKVDLHAQQGESLDQIETNHIMAFEHKKQKNIVHGINKK